MQQGLGILRTPIHQFSPPSAAAPQHLRQTRIFEKIENIYIKVGVAMMMDVDEDEDDAGLREIERLTTPRKRYSSRKYDDSSRGNGGGAGGGYDEKERDAPSHTDLFYVLKWIATTGILFYLATRNQVFFCVTTICGDFYLEEYFVFRKQDALKGQLLMTNLALSVILSRFVFFWHLPVQALLFLWFGLVCRRELLRLGRAEGFKSWGAVFFGLWAFCYVSQLDILSAYASYVFGFLVWWLCVSFAVHA